MAETPLRVGIVGANPDYGWGSGVHRRIVTMLPGVTLHGVCTTKAETAERAAREFGAALAFTDAAALAAHPEIDIVAICVRAPHHYAIARDALLNGKHVYCEWPLAFTIEQAEELAALAADRGCKAMIGLHLRGSPELRYAADLIRDGFIGRPYSINLCARVYGPTTAAMATRAGGTTLLSIYGGHLLDAIDHHFGGIRSFGARSAIHLPPVDQQGAPVARDAPDHYVVQGELGSGALFNFDLAGTSVAAMGSTWRIEGTGGSLMLTTADPAMPAMEVLSMSGRSGGGEWKPLTVPAAYDCAAIPPTPDRYPAYPTTPASRFALVSIGTLYGRLRDAIVQDGPVEPDFARAAAIQRLLDAVDRDQSIECPVALGAAA
ncbi:Gfo/Idh/MocA family protein [Sphingomonas crocodyli]|uniref:Gfo/Idh/MocA family oxidoreductase n=1 Tax=Sphingomonas crocodyli TaxID=1979270 RepID=A0A437M002_9SPHN|nr:Gfo/Idh/MocA family oxidoreductase [Sphingomonas crocodyli]RVT91019.1 Gfo/Idh/MocA family oxidoreductase [Sphingomonas crocodyli]